jgi:four helix bundle protein
MIRQYGFEKLSVWQNSRKLVKEVYMMTKKWPAEERFGLCNQVQRAVVSVSSNIAEGASRTSNKDQGHFYQTAYASLMEVLCQLTLCLDLGFIDDETYTSTRARVDLVAYQLNQLKSAALSQPSQPSQQRSTQPSKRD